MLLPMQTVRELADKMSGITSRDSAASNRGYPLLDRVVLDLVHAVAFVKGVLIARYLARPSASRPPVDDASSAAESDEDDESVALLAFEMAELDLQKDV